MSKWPACFIEAVGDMGSKNAAAWFEESTGQKVSHQTICNWIQGDIPHSTRLRNALKKLLPKARIPLRDVGRRSIPKYERDAFAVALRKWVGQDGARKLWRMMLDAGANLSEQTVRDWFDGAIPSRLDIRKQLLLLNPELPIPTLVHCTHESEMGHTQRARFWKNEEDAPDRDEFPEWASGLHDDYRPCPGEPGWDWVDDLHVAAFKVRFDAHERDDNGRLMDMGERFRLAVVETYRIPKDKLEAVNAWREHRGKDGRQIA